MEKQIENQREQVTRNDYETVANFLMNGDKKEVKEFLKHFNWEKFTEDTCEFMDIKFIRKYKDYIDWEMYCSNAELSEDFIREFADKVDWEFICDRFRLSEDFIREHKDYVDWEMIYVKYNLSEEFINEFKECLAEYIDKYKDEQFTIIEV